MKIMRTFPLPLVCLVLSFLFAQPSHATESQDLKIHVMDPKLPNVAIITTGGTVAEKADPASGKSVPAVSGIELVKAVPGLEKKGAILEGDLMGTKALLLLMLALAEVGNNPEKLKAYFK